MTKLRTLQDAAALVPDGATIAVGGLSLNGAPMAFVRELVRRGVKDLTVVSVVAGLPIDGLVAGGCVRRVVSGLVSLEGFGLAPNYRAAVQRGDVATDEYSEHTLVCRLQSAAYRLPFIPTRAGLGTDMVTLHPDTTRVEADPATGEQYVACTPLAIDVAIVHVNEADTRGNARMDPKLVWMDGELVKAAASTIVTAERIVDTSTFRARPGETTYPRFTVDAVAAAPWGAYPTSCLPEYGYDPAFLEDYQAASRDADTWTAFWNDRVVAPESQGAFLDANGGARLLTGLARRTA
ncbi:MAG: CoA transferase subunit A [Nostocoides sp.]